MEWRTRNMNWKRAPAILGLNKRNERTLGSSKDSTLSVSLKTSPEPAICPMSLDSTAVAGGGARTSVPMVNAVKVVTNDFCRACILSFFILSFIPRDCLVFAAGKCGNENDEHGIDVMMRRRRDLMRNIVLQCLAWLKRAERRWRLYCGKDLICILHYTSDIRNAHHVCRYFGDVRRTVVRTIFSSSELMECLYSENCSSTFDVVRCSTIYYLLSMEYLRSTLYSEYQDIR